MTARTGIAIGLAAGIWLAAGPASTQQPGPLAALEPGRWTFTGPNGEAIGAVCLGDPLQLAEPQHVGAACSRQLLSGDAHSVTITYSCPGTGRGRTMLRLETPRLVQFDNQGIRGGLPFALRGAVRRTGPC